MELRGWKFANSKQDEDTDNADVLFSIWDIFRWSHICIYKYFLVLVLFKYRNIYMVLTFGISQGPFSTSLNNSKRSQKSQIKQARLF